MSGKESGLSVRELLKKVYEGLKDEFPCEEIALPETARAEIADDSDWHRTCKGYMCYQSVLLLQVNNKTWVVGRGERCGSYPADPYDSDIVALEISPEGKSREEFISEIQKAIYKSTYFRNSLIYGLWYGNLTVNKICRFSEKILELLKPKISEFIARKPEVDSEIVHLDLRPVYKTTMSYKPEFVGFLVESIKTVLSSS